jgi:hypothetical protein
MGCISDQMIECWDNPMSSEHDPRNLLLLGAKEIRHLRKMIAAKDDIIHGLHCANVDLTDMIRSQQPHPDTAWYFAGLAVVAAVAVMIWMIS